MKKLVLAALLLVGLGLNAAHAEDAKPAKPDAAAPKVSLFERMHVESAYQKSAAGSSLQAFNTPDEPGSSSAWLKLAQAFCICMALLCAIIFCLKRYSDKFAKVGDKKLRVKERLPLTGKTALLLVEYEGRNMLVAVGSERVSFSDNDSPFRLAGEEERDFGMLCDESLKLPV